ncbi:cysteine desulfurase, putative [Trypanosoma brucei brucei TREU927]|uniref:cysteine desulfurase n=1 Tax=Trypanosoma brucei brucei (strain 927/4 GUTat10.1) TaxID=185431 RepID=Q38DC4_TRYB2|nr:cysteine desulfurase, putative [Trypanosoma brucei brucei TREU927]EAN77196.1 cysteine desulfurase, putative [Trypanosoma brucei brucei TREU927]
MCSIEGPPLKKLRPQPLTPTDPIPIYLDYNATTPLCMESWRAMSAIVPFSWGNPSSVHPYGLAAKFVLDEARGKVANAIRAVTPANVIFTSGGTEANNLAIIGGFTALRERFPSRHYIITTNVEHPAVEEVLKFLEREHSAVVKGGDRRMSGGKKQQPPPVEVYRFPVDPRTGCVRTDEWRKLLLELPGGPQNVALVTVMHANNEIGGINPIDDLVKLVKEICGEETLFHTDAAQSIGKVPVNVSAMRVDMLSICSHKFYGPKGVGALYVRDGVRIRNILFGANHENGARPGTENVLLVTGMAEALHVACKNLTANAATMRNTRDELFRVIKQEVSKVGMDCVLNGDIDHALPNTLSVALFKVTDSGKRRYISAHGLIQAVGDKVCMSSGAACHSAEENVVVSASLRSVGVDLDRAVGTLRLSTGRTTTMAEVRRAARIIVRRAVQQFGEF